jgi:hypothetical protein
VPNTNDLRAYADSAVQQGKQTLSTAQAQFSGVTGQASGLVNKVAGSVRDGARGNVADLRSSTEKLVNVDALRATLEPYAAQLRGYGTSVTDRVEELLTRLRSDPRFGKLFETADSVSKTVVGQVQERVVKPVQSRTGSHSAD